MKLLFNRRKAGTAGNVFQQAAATMVPVEGVDAPAYNKLYKQLGTRNNNKEVRSHIQQRLDSTIEAPMSPNFQLNVTAGYQMDNGMNVTTNRVNLQGRKE